MTTPSCPGPARVSTPVPGVLRTGPDPDRLSLVLAPPGSAPLTCRLVELTLPVGTRAEHLVADPAALTLAQAPDGWRLDHTEGDRFVLRPDAPVEIAPGARLVLTLGGVGIGTASGDTVLETGVTSGADGTAATLDTARFRIRTTGQALVETFQPDKADVTNPGQVTLTWKGAPPTDGVTYWLAIGQDAEKDVTSLTKDDGRGSCLSPPLTSTTAFLLHVRKGNDQQFLTCAVTVTKPDLTVGRLSAAGTVHLLNEPAAVIAPDTYRTAQGGTYSAATDGMLAAYVKATDQQGTASLIITTSDPETDDGHRYYASSTDESPANLLVPVPAGSEVSIDAAGGGQTTFSAQATWYPMGAGGLDKHQK